MNRNALYPAAAALVLALAARPARPCPIVATHVIEFPQTSNLCTTGIWAPSEPPAGLHRTLLPPPPGAIIVKTRIHATFVSTSICNPAFDAANLVFQLQNPFETTWEIHAGPDLDWSGTGTFSGTLETDLFNGVPPPIVWEDIFFSAVEMRVDGHFHTSVLMPDARWEIDYIDPAEIDGDVSCDNRVNFNDIPAFVAALIDPALYESEFPDCQILRADMNCDLLIDGNDVQPFLDAILNAPPIGACCINDGSCEELVFDACQLEGGQFNGVFSACDEVVCPPSTPQIDTIFFSPQPANNCDGDEFNVASLSVIGDGFHNDIQVEFTMAGQPNVRLFGIQPIDRQNLFGDVDLGCFPAAGSWNLLLTNPDGQTAILENAVQIDDCPTPAYIIEIAAFSPAEVLTCPGDGPVNPVTQLTVDIFGANLPPDLNGGSFESSVRINLTAASDGEHWYSLLPDQITVIAPGHYQAQYSIFNGNVNFPVSNPPAGIYRITISMCSQTLNSTETVEIREECPP